MYLDETIFYGEMNVTAFFQCLQSEANMQVYRFGDLFLIISN